LTRVVAHGSISGRRITVAIVGAGIAGLAAARALRAAGVTDYRLFELEDAPGGNSRAGTVASLPCPWGAHYLPVPDPADRSEAAGDLRALLREVGALHSSDGRDSFDERMLCHAPQERLLIDGRWHGSLLPPAELAPGAQDDYRRFADLIAAERATGLYPLPSAPSLATNPRLAALDRQTFAQWLDDHRLTGEPLRWYLDYCCRDDYGAGIAEVSAWAGVHYFASRHGFFAPSSPGANDYDDRTEVLTWPQGNGWLVERLAAPHDGRIQTGSLVRAVHRARGGGDHRLEVWRAAAGLPEEWHARYVIFAAPLFVAARVLQPLPEPLAALRPYLRYSSWQVANLYLPRPPAERPGVPRAWDNVIYGGSSLGYVDAGHQTLASRPGATVFTCYQSEGPSTQARQALYDASWKASVDRLLAQLTPAHADIRDRVAHVDIMRWGHAMLVPVPGLRSRSPLAALMSPGTGLVASGTGSSTGGAGSPSDSRLAFAHSDLAGYSIFEEAFAHGMAAGRVAAAFVSGQRN
ncbi:MAG TPA: FAD-dependent oxidoreductase, partial [Burkholderiaceae bacterium]|nr:FAD-dependent oxidoreductase [Burkholderiaceae bacterium]